ncbi:MAG: hypothetical protein RL748_1598 [Pseudomonadota bacterium]|jgi:hypothetical protein
MAIVLTPTTVLDADAAISLEQYVDFINQQVDIDDPDSLIASAPQLAALAANKHLLRDKINAALKHPAQFQQGNLYTDTSLMLWSNSNDGNARKRFFVRANIWVAPKVYANNASLDAELKAYQIAHNHNFSLLTAGYWGPGYSTDIYDLDADNMVGEVGEKVGLQFQQSVTLSEGSILFFRRFRDVHIQHPPPDLSISLNLIPLEKGKAWAEQYDFDVETQTITAITHTDVWNRVDLIHMAALLGDGNTADIISHLAKTVDNQRVQHAAQAALAQLSKN